MAAVSRSIGSAGRCPSTNVLGPRSRRIAAGAAQPGAGRRTASFTGPRADAPSTPCSSCPAAGDVARLQSTIETWPAAQLRFSAASVGGALV